MQERTKVQSRVRASAVVVHDGKLLCTLGQDPVTGQQYHFLPGGKIEAEETAPEAAERETLEETGFLVSVDPRTCIDGEYFFTWGGQEFDCLTLFYRGQLTSPIQKQKPTAETTLAVVWISIDQIESEFKSHPVILKSILELVSWNQNPLT